MEPEEFFAYLHAHGGPTARDALDGGVDAEEVQRAQEANRAAEDRRLREVSLSVDDAAERLCVTPEQVADMLQRGALWSYPDGAPWASDFDGETRIPLWQFTGNGLIPYLAMVVAAIPPDWSPSAIEAAMTLADEDFNDLSPVEYLIQDGDPAVVAAKLAELPYRLGVGGLRCRWDMSVRDEVHAAAARIGLPPLELRTPLAQACADGKIPEELALAHCELVEYMLAGQPRGAPRLPRGATEAMLPTPPPGGGYYAAPGHLVLSLEGIEALAAEAGIHLHQGKIATIYARAETMTHGVPGELLDRMYELLAHLARAADHPGSSEI